MMASCEFRRRFRACGEPGVAGCQYCGRSFCERHGARLGEGQEICSRALCQQKRADLEVHFAYKKSVGARNKERICGEADCGQAPGGQCSKCQGLFCFRHLEERAVEVRSGSTSSAALASVCRHCHKRRGLWSRV